MKKGVAIIAIMLAFGWNIQPISDLENVLLQLFIVGKIPGTEIYLDFVSIIPIVLVLFGLIFYWIRQLMVDFIDFSADFNRQQQATQAIINSDQSPALSLSPEEELDLLSI